MRNSRSSSKREAYSDLKKSKESNIILEGKRKRANKTSS